MLPPPRMWRVGALAAFAGVGMWVNGLVGAVVGGIVGGLAGNWILNLQ